MTITEKIELLKRRLESHERMAKACREYGDEDAARVNDHLALATETAIQVLIDDEFAATLKEFLDKHFR